MKCIVPIAGPDYFQNNFCKGLYEFKNDFFLRKILYSRPWIQKVDELIFIMQDIELARDFEKKYLKNWFKKSKVIFLPSFTKGATFSTLAGVALAYDDFDSPIIVDLADIYFETDFVPYRQNENSSYVFYFLNENPLYSYLKVDDNENVIKTREKKVISNRASAGVYCFPSTSSFIRCTSYSIENKKDLTHNNLHYVCPLINYLIKEGIKTIPIEVNNVLDIKTLN